ncbi:Lrp/AsnC family transcriptional regulator [Thermogemmatispora sp.]|uniref:Lrp/AsnC family transcriptional regulator n=1 Tax=Thermogemmatispora sp. TaxID=1968838 RepID=UPI0035E46025
MTGEIERLLDATGWQLLEALQQQARLSYRELGQRVGLSAPAVSERVRRLEEAGLITGYHAEVNLDRLGLPVRAIIRMSLASGQSSARAIASIREIAEVIECSRVTGEETLILKGVATSVEHLESLIDRLLAYGSLTTSLILSTPIPRRVVTPDILAWGRRKAKNAL